MTPGEDEDMEERLTFGKKICARGKNQMWKMSLGKKKSGKRLVGKNDASRKLSTNEKLRNVTVKNRSPKLEF